MQREGKRTGMDMDASTASRKLASWWRWKVTVRPPLRSVALMANSTDLRSLILTLGMSSLIVFLTRLSSTRDGKERTSGSLRERVRMAAPSADATTRNQLRVNRD